MQDVRVTGKLVNQLDMPLQGEIAFIPSRLWVDEDGATYPVPSPVVTLDEDGEFEATIVRTDQHGLSWHYKVVCPNAQWTIFVTADGPMKLKNLVPKRYTA